MSVPLKSGIYTQLPDSLRGLLAARHAWRDQGKRVVWSNGCFDVLHVGHVRSLEAARSFGDILIVGLNSDRSVRQLKGSGRPILPENERAELLVSLKCVDAVLIFDETTPEVALTCLQPDIHCKGADYAPPAGKPIPEKALVESYGGRVEFLPLFEGLSTSNIVERMQKKSGGS